LISALLATRFLDLFFAYRLLFSVFSSPTITLSDSVNRFDIALAYPYSCFRGNWYPTQAWFYISLPSAVAISFHFSLAPAFQFRTAISLFVLGPAFDLPHIFCRC
jgi:hypothetical protein